MSEEIINLDALVPKTITFTKTINGEVRSWQLRDGMPSVAVLPALALRLHNTQRVRDWAAIPLPQVDDDDVNAMAKAEQALAMAQETYAARVAETLTVFATIWHASRPKDATEDLAAWFTLDEQEDIIKLFFTRPSSVSSAPSNTTTPVTPTETSETTVPNRATRRHSSRAAIPSQKRLSRELRGL